MHTDTLPDSKTEKFLSQLTELKRKRVRLLLKKFKKHAKKLEEIATEIEGYGVAPEDIK